MAEKDKSKQEQLDPQELKPFRDELHFEPLEVDFANMVIRQKPGNPLGWWLGDYPTNYSEFETDGTLEFHGNATVWDDLRIVPGAFQFAGNADPTLQTWQPGGAGTEFKVYKFKENDEVFFTCQIPHSYKEGTDIGAHLHWTPGDRGVAEGTAVVAWKLDYSWANIDAVFASSATVDLSDACQSTNDLSLIHI